MKETLYSKRSNLIIGFHGCDRSVVDKVINGKDNLIASTNDYDWLGNGIYFWENNEERQGLGLSNYPSARTHQ